MDSAHTGETTIRLAGQALTLVYDWHALSALRTQLGESAMATLDGVDPDKLAAVLAIGLRRHHPDWTAERVMEASPPLVPAAEAFARAMNRALYGADEPPARGPTPPAPA